MASVSDVGSLIADARRDGDTRAAVMDRATDFPNEMKKRQGKWRMSSDDICKRPYRTCM